MKVLGWILAIIAGLTIFYNVWTSVENERIAAHNLTQIQDNFWVTLLSGGGTLQEGKPCYTFRPPYTGFEMTVMAAGVIGIALIVFGSETNNKQR